MRFALFLALCLTVLYGCDGLITEKAPANDGIFHRIRERIRVASNEADDLNKVHNPESFLQGKNVKSGKRKVDSAVKLGFFHSFLASISVVIVSEIGDKTFFIAAILAMRHSRLTVFIGAMGALASMTILSVLLGYLTTALPRKFTYYLSSLLFALFGLKMLKDGYQMSPNEGLEEYEEVQADIRKRDEEYLMSNSGKDVETGIIKGSKQRSFLLLIFSKVFLEAFTLTFCAEFGDRSQMTTIILAARENLMGVVIGGILGHAFCTGMAVLGGRMIAQRISVKTVTLIGGFVFIIFALSAFFIGPASNS